MQFGDLFAAADGTQRCIPVRLFAFTAPRVTKSCYGSHIIDTNINGCTLCRQRVTIGFGGRWARADADTHSNNQAGVVEIGPVSGR